MNIGIVSLTARRLAVWPHFLLAAHLFMLHTLAFGGWQIPAVRLLWVVALGLFLIWQPFVIGEQRIEFRQGGVLFALVLTSTLLLGPWLLLVWCGALAAAIGGRVLGTERRRERLGYLLAFGYLICVIVLGAVPEISPVVALDPLLRSVFARFMPLVLPFLLLFPAEARQRKAAQAFDLFYGVMVFLILAVFILGALAYMLLAGAGYVEALFKTSLAVAGALLVVAWAWNPHSGFAGIGAAISRYMMSAGMPLEEWLARLAEESERHADPVLFLDAIIGRLQEIPWVVGVSWTAGPRLGLSGTQTGYGHTCQANEISLSVHFRQAPSPAMDWHVEWLLRLAVEFYLVKAHTHRLQRMGYVQAIYETGARVTHDVKNLLQSLQVLCYAANQPGDPAEVAALLGRQLPQITDRLKATLDKLQSPDTERLQLGAAAVWWRAFKERYEHLPVVWLGEPTAGETLPGALFDSVAENLLQNALAKRQRQPGLTISVRFADGCLIVSDDGSAVAPSLSCALFREPVASEDGLGIGLYHAAQQAEGAGYLLALSDNRPGCVAFSLSPRR
ncbi:sensor histidine kinase [Dechloromonas sp. HYN0024]|uniref:sensor histidine kinase n=1 Tax=Dechloromonas sp. HYN0024 TaxID=2231055 RepID=UPI000E43FDC8|nr:sensor histidine kinase [Dechloromonas sp. HYN0024]AXS80766.1 sensor histidine kinase [Dechloromonas sp. HYN0024]